MFGKILIANRGEIAVRIVRAARDLGIPTVQVYSAADADMAAVRLADEAVCCGPARATDSYLDMPAIISAAEVTDAVAIHPGYGFLSENADFAERCESSGFIFIGPPASAIRQPLRWGRAVARSSSPSACSGGGPSASRRRHRALGPVR